MTHPTMHDSPIQAYMIENDILFTESNLAKLLKSYRDVKCFDDMIALIAIRQKQFDAVEDEDAERGESAGLSAEVQYYQAVALSSRGTSISNSTSFFSHLGAFSVSVSCAVRHPRAPKDVSWCAQLGAHASRGAGWCSARFGGLRQSGRPRARGAGCG